MSAPPNVNCPTCRKVNGGFATPFDPFCSKRCRLIDLGKWFAEEHAIFGPLRPEQLGETDEPSADERPDPLER